MNFTRLEILLLQHIFSFLAGKINVQIYKIIARLILIAIRINAVLNNTF